MPVKRSTRGLNQRLWYRVYRERVRQLQEYCRGCKVVCSDLTFDHVIPYALEGTTTFDNMTLLCPECNQLKADNVWKSLRSLAEEEESAPLERRWARIESDRVLRVQISQMHEEALQMNANF